MGEEDDTLVSSMQSLDMVLCVSTDAVTKYHPKVSTNVVTISSVPKITRSTSTALTVYRGNSPFTSAFSVPFVMGKRVGYGCSNSLTARKKVHWSTATSWLTETNNAIKSHFPTKHHRAICDNTKPSTITNTHSLPIILPSSMNSLCENLERMRLLKLETSR
jgi:hypothetical protein